MKVKSLVIATIVLFALSFLPYGAYAQFTKGTVVQLVNRSYGKAATVANASWVSCVDRDNTDYSQLWYVEARSYNAIPIGYKVRLRNLGNGRYLQGNNNPSTPWGTVKSSGSYTADHNGESTYFTTELWEAQRDGYYTLGAENKKTGNTDYYYDKLHCDASGTCVSWMGAADASLWSIEVVSGIDVQAQWDKLAQFENMANRKDEFQGYLNTLFTDNLCTELRSSYKSQSALLASSAYQALPQELKDMAMKVCNGNWAETNKDNVNVSWTNAAAKRFRVQTIEPHSVAEEICEVVKVGAYSNMNNPTGLYAGEMDMLYIMVKGDINQGSALYLAGLNHNSKDYLTSIAGCNPVQLHTGLNVVPFYGDKSMLYLLYSVNSQSSSYPLTNYPDIEVHIEGGCIRGLYDRSMNDEDIFSELSKNASKLGMEYYDVLGEKFVFRTSWETVFKNNTASSINRALDMWDTIGLSQHLVMGIASADEVANDPLSLHEYTSDFSKVFNNRQLVHTIPTLAAYTQAPFRIQFAHGEGLLQGDVMEKGGYIWGPAHEQGHANQNVINMVGTTEISNNLFSNVAVFYQDYLLSRGGTVADNCEGYKADIAWHFRDSNSRMRMFYQLWLYYHAAGKNKDFYPKLFEYLRNDPMTIHPSSVGDVYTANESLKFYKYACLAAGEDLTPFFEAWGFFVPFEKTEITDYNTYSVVNLNSDIISAKNTVAAYGFPKNYAAIFIEDRIGDVVSRKYTGHKKDWIDKALDNVGSIGMFSDFIGDKSLDGEFVWVETARNIVEVSGGDGAAGIIIEKSGVLYSFFNTLELELDDIMMNGIKSGECKIKVVGVDGQLYDVKSVDESENAATKRTVLKSMMDNADDVVKYVDYDGCKVGYYNPIYTAGIELLLEKARTVYEKGISDEYDVYIDKLSAEISKFKDSGDATIINVADGCTYRIENKLHDGKRMYLAANKEVDGAANPVSDTDKWIFEYSGSGIGYYIKNKINGCYIDKMTTYSQQVYADETSRSTADVYNVMVADDKTVSFTGTSYLLHLDSWMNVVGWFSDAEASYWHVRRTDVPETETAMFEMNKMAACVKWLLEEISTNVIFGQNFSVGGVNAKYKGVVELQELVDACRSVSNAQNMANASHDAYMNMYKELNSHYTSLKKAYDMGNDVELKKSRLALTAAVGDVRSLLSGNLLSGALKLQCTDRSAPNYISSNAEHNAGGAAKDGAGLPALLDGSKATYFHSRWAGTVVNENHYIQVDLGSGNSVTDFCFSYSAREGAHHAIPSGMVVSGSNDGANFEQIITLGRQELVGAGQGGSADYSLNSNFAAVTKKGRKLSSVRLNSPGCGDQTANLANPSALYNDLTETVFNVLPGETVTASFVKDGDWNWMHGYIYVDTDNNGFEASVDGFAPTGDMVSYSFYGSESDETSGRNSLGNYISGDGRNVLDPPSFTAPSTPGLYRMRYKVDWNSVDPKGDNNSNFGGTIADTDGCIVDVMLRVGDVQSAAFSGDFVSDTISCGNEFRYLRFTVTESDCFVESHNCSSEHLQYNGYHYFCISEFGLVKFETVSPEGTWLPLYVDEANALLADAEMLLENGTAATQLDACTNRLLQMADTLGRALKTPLPVELTANVNNPVFYRIISVVGNSPLEYETDATANLFDATDAPINLVSFADSNDNVQGQAWYFMRGTDVGHYYLSPKQGNEKVLGANPAWSQVMLAGEGRVWSVERNIQGYITEWKIKVSENGRFVFSPVYETPLVMGRHDADSQRLGFVDDASSENAMFVVEKTELDYTGIDNPLPESEIGEGGVYDIYGRRVERVVSPGLYIVNGKKTYLRP